jgi:SAM-dependent methyltransferase
MNPSDELSAQYSERAAAYTKLWEPVLRPMSQPLLRALPLASARHILDLGAGTGALMSDLAAAAPQAAVLGADRAEGMLRMARGAALRTVALMDAERLAVRSDLFDAVVLAFMLFHVPNPTTCLAEVRRALRAGGAIGLVTWGEEPDLPGMAIWNEELDAHGAAPDPRDSTVMRHALMDRPDKLERLLEDAGFVSVRVWSESFEYRWTTEHLLAIQMGCGMPGRRLPTLPSDKRATCRGKVAERIARLTEAELVYRPDILYTVAKRPD